MKVVRTENNYVKHNGHVSSNEDRQDFVAGRVDLKSGDSEMLNQKLYRERGVNINQLSSDIKECINEILNFLDTYMKNHVDDIYEQLVKLSNTIQR